MITTAFLSMWISNTATTAMMAPIAEAVLAELNQDKLKAKVKETRLNHKSEGNVFDEVDAAISNPSAGWELEDVQNRNTENSEEGGNDRILNDGNIQYV